MDDNEDYVIRELTPELLTDYLTYFDTTAFADNPKWASCYCYFPHAPHSTENWHDRTGEQNRTEVSGLIHESKMHGYLAYHDDKPVGWCNAGPRVNATILDDEPGSQWVGAIVCFVVAKSHRGKGVARRLLEAACEGFQRQGFEIAEGYPRPDANDDATSHFGPMSLFLSAGFEPFKEEGGSVIVRKVLECAD